MCVCVCGGVRGLGSETGRRPLTHSVSAGTVQKVMQGTKASGLTS